MSSYISCSPVPFPENVLSSGNDSDPAGRSVLSLDGDWDLVFDDVNAGKDAGWDAAFPKELAVTASVPSVWERIRPGYDGVGWYRRLFVLPEGWEHRTLRLRFHAAQYFAEVWLNGVRLGSNEGGFLPFEFAVTKQVRSGDNELIVRVINPPMDREIEGFRCGAPLNQGPIPIGKAGWYYNFGGLWQGVELQATQAATITHVGLEPWPSRDEVIACVEVESEADAGACELHCRLLAGEGGEAVFSGKHRWELRRGLNTLRWSIPCHGARLWSVEDPFLHTADLTLSRGDLVCDHHAVRFGMREFSVRHGRFILNGEPIVLKGFLHQGSYPRTLVAPEDRAFAERELRIVKDNGFNFVRAHLQPALPWWLDLCDELGLLVMAEPPIGWIEANPHAEARCWREISGLVRRDGHHASVVVWCLMNEVFHLKGFTAEELCGMTAKWLRQVQQLDPTRPVIDVSGGHGISLGGAADMLPNTAAGHGRTACMLLPGEKEPLIIRDAHTYGLLPMRDTMWQAMRTSGAGEALFFTSEYGAPAVPPFFRQVMEGYTRDERALGLEDYRLHRDFSDSLRDHWRHPMWAELFGNEEAWIEKNSRSRAEEMRLVTTALRSNPRSAGYCFCQLADASGELFGAVDAWRRPKPMLKALAEGSAPGTLGVFVSSRIVVQGGEVKAELVWLDERSGDVCGEWSLALVNEAGRKVSVWSKTFSLSASGPHTLLSVDVKLPMEPGVYRLQAWGRANTTGDLAGYIEFRVVPKTTLPAGTIAVAPAGSPLQSFLDGKDRSVVPFGNNFREVHLPVLFDLSKPLKRLEQMEVMGQLRKVLQVGGAAVVFEPEMTMLGEELVGGRVRMRPLGRPIGYTQKHPVFDGLPQGEIPDYTYAEVQPEKYDRVDDIHALGGEVLYGALSMHMWTRPAAFFHGAALYTIPVGRGTLVVCNLRILDQLEISPVAALLLDNLMRFAQSRIQVSDTAPLLSRCIDPYIKDDIQTFPCESVSQHGAGVGCPL